MRNTSMQQTHLTHKPRRAILRLRVRLVCCVLGGGLFLLLLDGFSWAAGPDKRPPGAKEMKSIMLTPDTMAAQEFSISCRFTAAPEGDSKKPGLLQVHLAFDATKGPGIAKVTRVSLVMRDGDETLLSVPVQMASGASPKVHRYVRLLVRKDALPKLQLALFPLGFDPPPSHLVDLGAFYKAAGAEDKKRKTGAGSP